MRERAAISILLLLLSGSAGAQSLRDLRAHDADDRALSREAAYTSKVCGRPIDASIDWRSAVDWPADESLADACDGALSAIETICRAGKTEIVSSFVCAGDGSGPSLSGSTLRYGASPGRNGYASTLATIGGRD